MDVADRYEVPAPPEVVWRAMFDPAVMRQVLPGCRELREVGPSVYEVTLAAGIGVLRGVFRGSVEFADLVEPVSCRMSIAATGSLGRVVGGGSISLEPVAAGTLLAYAATFTFAGPMAGLGEGLMRGVADALTREALSRFTRLVAASVEIA